MELTFRHGIIRHQIDTSGTATFLHKAGSNDEYIDLVCDEDHLSFTIAHGPNANYLVVIPRTVSHAWGPLQAHGETQYLFWDISLLDASVSYGYTTINPYYGVNEPPSPVTNDQHWYDTSINQMKVWNGTKWIPKLRLFAGTYTNNAILVPRPRGSQVGLSSAHIKAGNIILGNTGKPLRDTDGTFITTESSLISSHTSGENLRLETIQLFGQALEFIPKFSVVTYDVPGKVKLASKNRPEEYPNGVMLEEKFIGEVGNIVPNGIVRNDQWDFANADINKPLYIGANGDITLTEPTLQDKYVIGRVYDKTGIFVDIQWRGGIGQVQTTVNVTLAGDVTGSGPTSSAIATTLSDTGITAGTYNNLTVDTKGRATSGTVEPYLLHNETITLTGDASGSGSTSIPVTLTDVATPGTYNTVTIDAKGRVVNGSFVPTIPTAPLLVTFSNSSNLEIADWSSKLLKFNGSEFLGVNYGLGTTINPGDVHLELRPTGVTPGTYNSVTINAKGLVTSASTITPDLTSTLSGDVTGSGSTSIVTTLSDTGVTPGSYNLLDVDSKGRVSSASLQPYLTSVTLTGVVTGTGSNTITTSLSPTGVVPGTWNSLTVNAEGRIVAASNVDYDTDTTLTGDVTSPPGRGIIPTTLSNTGVTPGTYNSLTVDAKGRVTSASIVPTSFSTTLTGDITGSGTGTFATTLSNTGVVPGTYNSFTVDAKGRITSASIIADLVGATNLDELTDVTLTSPSNNQVLQYNGSQWVNTTLPAVSGVEYLNDLLDVTIATPVANQSLLFNGTEWNNAVLDRIASGTTLLYTSPTKISHNFGASEVVVSTSAMTTFGIEPQVDWWYSKFGHSSTLLNDVSFIAQCHIVEPSTGHIIVGGSVIKPGTLSVPERNGFVIKYSASGQVLWATHLQGWETWDNPQNVTTNIPAIALDSSGNVIVLVESLGRNNLVKLNGTTFAEIWQVGIRNDNPGNTYATSLVIDNSSNIYVAGNEGTHAFVSKFNSSGTRLTDATIMHHAHANDSFKISTIVLDNVSSALHIVGHYYDWTNDEDKSKYISLNTDTFTVNSECIFNFSFAYPLRDVIQSGTFLYFLSSAIPGNNNKFNVSKYDTISGTITISKEVSDISGTYQMAGSSLAIDSSGNVYVSGTRRENFSGDYEFYFIKLDSSLGFVWQRVFGSPIWNDKIIGSQNITIDGSALYLTGTSTNNYTDYSIALKYPIDGSISGTFGSYTIASTTIGSSNITPTSDSSPFASINVGTPAQYNQLVHYPVIVGYEQLTQISLSSSLYSVQLFSDLKVGTDSGVLGQFLMSTGAGNIPEWSPLPTTVASLNDLTDVVVPLSPLVAKNVLYYTGTEWNNKTLAFSDLQNTSFGTLSTNDAIYWNGSNWVNGPITATQSNVYNYTYGQITSSTVTISSNNTSVMIDYFGSDQFRTAEYLIQFQQGTNYYSTKAVIIANHVEEHITEYGQIFTTSAIGTLSVQRLGSFQVMLMFSGYGDATVNNINIKIMRTTIRV